MTWRTPPSLKWLIVKRSRLSGALLKLDDERTRLGDKIRSLDRRASTLREQLAALDQTFGLHEIPMEPTIIRPIRPQTRPWLLPRGQLSRIIFRELRLSGGWLSTTDMVIRISAQLPEEDPYDLEVTRVCIRRRLRALSKKGRIERRNAGISVAGTHDGSTETYWRLAAVATHGVPPSCMASVQN